MNTNKRILLIDDEIQNNNLQKIVRELKSIFTVTTDQITVLDEKLFQDNGIGEFDFEKLKEEIRQKVKSKDLILVDYDYGVTININGLDVIQAIRTFNRKVPIILYTADQKKVISDIIGGNINKENLDTEKISEVINNFIDYKIEKICPRNNYEAETIRLLKSGLDETPRNILCHLLRDYGDKVFNSCCPRLKGKTFNEIADILEEDNNGAANEFLQAIFEQLLAYLVKVNE